MSLAWNTQLDGYRAVIPVDFSTSALVYRSNMVMNQKLPIPPLTSGTQYWGDIASSNVIVIGENDHFILAGAVTAFRSLTILRALLYNRRISGIEMYQPDIRPGEKPEESVILEGSDWRELLVQYADIAAEKMGVKPIKADKNMTGYCSWYYYYKGVTQENFLENIDALAANRSPYAAEYVQIDDGYQAYQGDWLEPRKTWPMPLKDIAAKIIKNGMKAGIWIMPTTACTTSRVYREHPDWFVKNEKGETATLPGWDPVPDNIWACLDTTIPEVRDYITHVFKTFRSWGFTYFKMDGLYFGLQRGIRRDPNATPVSAFRLLLKTIREAVPDSIIMGCSEPYMACLGLIDNARVSDDTGLNFCPTVWENAPQPLTVTVLESFHTSMSNFWMFDRWFRADPDVMMARQDNCNYNRNQAKFSILSGIMTGVALTSDHLGTINANRNALLAKAQNIRMRNVRPLHSRPNVWAMEYEGTIDGKRAVAVVNDSPVPRTWTMKDLGMPENCYDLLDDRKVFNEITMPCNDAALLIAE